MKIPFSIIGPGTDETISPGERCSDSALRLAIAKSRSVGGTASNGSINKTSPANALVIGSDQVAELNGVALGKPGTRERAFAQLQSMRGQTVIFHTAVALFDIASGRSQSQIVPTTVTLRSYSDRQINYYLDHENALDCAGSAKSEGLGAALIARMASDDPTALVGLPLIALTTMLAREGIEVLS